MNLSALQHLIRAAQALAENQPVIVLGSSSLLASFPELGKDEGPLTTTFDADLYPDPFDELVAMMWHEALGENRSYYLRHGYHADIMRDSIVDTFPSGWRERLVPVPGADKAHALEPHDLCAIKILVGRPKDLSLVKFLADAGLIHANMVRERMALIDLPVELRPRMDAAFRWIFEA
jgi:hypothetical protein